MTEAQQHANTIREEALGALSELDWDSEAFEAAVAALLECAVVAGTRVTALETALEEIAASHARALGASEKATLIRVRRIARDALGVVSRAAALAAGSPTDTPA